MSDPRYTDPRYNDPRLSDPVLRQNDGIGGTWGWIVGMAVIVLIAIVMVAGWHGGGNTASNSPAVATDSAPMRNVTPPSTTGSGTTSPRPTTPLTPAIPAPSKNGTQ